MINPFDEKEIVTNSDMRRNLPLDLNPDLIERLDSLAKIPSYQNESINTIPSAYQPPIPKPTPTFKETFINSLHWWHGLSQTEPLNPLSDNTPAGWSASLQPESFVGINEKYHSYLAQSSSPNDLYFRRLEAERLQQEDEYFENGSMLAKFTGGFVDSLPFALIPLGQATKYATLGKTFYEAALSAYPGLLASNLLHEGSIQATKIGGSIQETLLNSYVDTLAGLAFMGTGAGLSRSFDGVKLFDARKMMKFNFSGIDAEMKISSDGKLTGYQAVAQPGYNVSAAEVDSAQSFLDSSFAMNGLFAIPKIGGLISKTVSAANPIVRGLTSPFETVRGFTDRVASHGLITEGIKAGRAKPEDFETLMGIVQGQNKQYYNSMQILHERRNEINSTSAAGRLAEKTYKKWQDEGYITPEQFGKEVKEVIISGNSNANSSVNEAAALTREYLDDTWKLYRDTFNLPKDWMPPPTADGYFPRVYNTGLMMERPEQWQNMWVEWWTQADREINSAMRPLNELKESIKTAKELHASLQGNPASTPEEIKASSKELKAMRRRYTKMRQDLADQIRNDRNMFLHGEDHSALSGKESRELKKLLKPSRMINREIKKQKENVQKLNESKFFLENKLENESNKEKISSLKNDVKQLENDLEVERNNLRELESKLSEEDLKLQDLVSEGKINSKFYNAIEGSSRVKFKNPNNLLKLRKPFESEYMMRNHADALRDTILNQTPEDSLRQVLGHYTGMAGENVTLKRTQMIPDGMLQSNNFLSDNMPLIVSNYRNVLHRRIAMKQVFGDVTIDGGIEPIIARLTREFKNKENILIANKELSEAEQAKLLKKLNKQFQEAKEFMSLSHQRMMGGTKGGKKMNKFIRFMRLWTVSTRLGSVPLSMTTDFTANIYKHGFWPTIRDGLLPALQNIEHEMKTGNAGPYRENLCHAHLGLNNVLGANNDRDWGGIAIEQVPLTGTLGNFMEHAAHISGNIALTNQTENSLQRLAANIIQSKVIRYLIEHQEGKLKEKDLHKLLKYGLDPKEWGERFISNWKKHGYEDEVKGGYQSYYFKWDDVEAANKMSRTIYKGVQDTIIRRGMMDSPFFFDDPVWGTILFFHGWSTAALTRYLVPLMQRPDAEHLTGLVWMLAAGSLVSPLRRLAKGEAAIDEDSNMFKDALTDSGILSPIMSIVEDANILTNGRLLHGISNDRYRQRSFAGSIGGPVAGVANDVTRILGMMLIGRLNETDVKKAGRLIPTIQPWYLKGLQNKAIESLGLPRTLADAEKNSANAYRY